MKISVCMATYNGELFVEEQLKSILSQIDESDEIVISDDHSTDNTLNVIKSINDPRIKIYLNDLEKGYARNFENAIRKSSGEIIFLSDQDDVWVDNKVEIMLEALKINDLVISDAEIVDGQLNQISPSHFELFNVHTGFLYNLIKTRYVGACMAFKRKMLERLIPFPQKQEFCAHDYWITVIGEAYYKVDLVKVPLLKYRRHGLNASTGGNKSSNSLGHKLTVRAYTLYNLIQRIRVR